MISVFMARGEDIDYFLSGPCPLKSRNSGINFYTQNKVFSSSNDKIQSLIDH